MSLLSTESTTVKQRKIIEAENRHQTKHQMEIMVPREARGATPRKAKSE